MVGRERLVELLVEVRVVPLVVRIAERGDLAGVRDEPLDRLRAEEAVELDRAVAAQRPATGLDERLPVRALEPVNRIAVEVDEIGEQVHRGDSTAAAAPARESAPPSARGRR